MRTVNAIVRSRFFHFPKPDFEPPIDDDGKKKKSKITESDQARLLIAEVYDRQGRLDGIKEKLGDVK